MEARVAGWLDEGDGIDRTLRVLPRARSVTRGLSGIVALAALAAVLASGCASRVDEAGRGGARAGDDARGAVRAEKPRVHARGAGRRRKARAARNGTIPRGARTDVVAYVVDGDTVALARLGRARLIGIDTPETVHPTKPVEWMGKEASEKNKELVLGKTVVLEKDVSETDR
ncbi:MAG: thermonuclease family protein, partial [Thermoleophilum sp.]|nr:thermonuclease family protein [Thermoleophilum sp.]